MVEFGWRGRRGGGIWGSHECKKLRFFRRRSSEIKVEEAEEEVVNRREECVACESAAKRVDSHDYSNLPMVSGVQFVLKRVLDFFFPFFHEHDDGRGIITGCENCSVDTLEVLLIDDTILFERDGEGREGDLGMLRIVVEILWYSGNWLIFQIVIDTRQYESNWI